MTAYQRSSDANLGLPADIYHLYLISRQIELPLKSITLNLGNVHIYENNIDKTEQLLAGNENVKFELKILYDLSVSPSAPFVRQKRMLGQGIPLKVLDQYAGIELVC